MIYQEGDYGEWKITESENNSRLIRYLTKKGANVDPTLIWKCVKNDMLRSNGRPVGKRQSEIEADQRCGKLRRCSRITNFAPFSELVKCGGASKIAHEACFSKDSQRTNYESDIPLSCLRKIGPDCFQGPKIKKNPSQDVSTSDDALSILAPTKGCERRNSCESFNCFGSLSSSSSFSRNCIIRLNTHTAHEVTVLLIDIQGFTNQCASLPAARVGEWVAAFYSRVDKVAAAHGVQKVAVRGDCCIVVAGLEGSVPFPVTKALQAPDLKSDQATRMLAFAAALHSSLATLSAGGAPTATRMGVATGDITFLVNAAAGSEAAPCAGVQGEVVEMAALLESKAAQGKVYVHRSTADRWAAEAHRPPPPTALMEGRCGGAERAAVYDCVARAFQPLPAAAAAPVPGPPQGLPGRDREGALRRITSACF